MKKIVWLASWFPTEDKMLDGDFIERHAKATALFVPVHLLHVCRTKLKHVNTGIHLKTYEYYPRLSAEIYYYKIAQIGKIGSFISYCYSLLLYIKLVRKNIKENGKPDLIHVHVSLRCGLVALFFKWFYKIPFIVTEHYAGYMPGAKKFERGKLSLNFLPLKSILQNSETIITVSKALGDALRQKFRIKKNIVIPNVVDTKIFYPTNKTGGSPPTIFLHISTLTPQKNPEQMLQAFAILKYQFHTDFDLWIVGPQRQHLLDLSQQLNIDKNIIWHKETSQENLAVIMQKADVLILYSRFESFGCVNIEAMACGLPVIVSDIPVFREYLKEGVNAYFAKPASPPQLAAVLHSFIDSPKKSRETISQYVADFSYSTVGRQIKEVYSKIIASGSGKQVK